jgi:hypothetical protein
LIHHIAAFGIDLDQLKIAEPGLTMNPDRAISQQRLFVNAVLEVPTDLKRSRAVKAYVAKNG